MGPDQTPTGPEWCANAMDVPVGGWYDFVAIGEAENMHVEAPCVGGPCVTSNQIATAALAAKWICARDEHKGSARCPHCTGSCAMALTRSDWQH